MALNKEVFKTRTLTAVIFAAIILTGLLWNRWSFTALFIIIHFGCWYEFVKLMKKINTTQFVKYLPLGLTYISMPLIMMIDMRFDNIIYKGSMVFLDLGYIIPCAIIFSIWTNDTLAYLVGSMIGKTPFSKISPKKTWEGTAGGALLCVAVIGFVGYLLNDFKTTAIIAAICAVFGTMGDLLESKIKRMADVKDSGNFMPGHGGFLDRFDSLLVAAPFVWIYIKFLA